MRLTPDDVSIHKLLVGENFLGDHISHIHDAMIISK
jgi:hypothetical protein